MSDTDIVERLRERTKLRYMVRALPSRNSGHQRECQFSRTLLANYEAKRILTPPRIRDDRHG